MKRISVAVILLSMLCLGVFARGKQPVALKNLPDPVKQEVLKSFQERDIQFITVEKKFRNYEYTFMIADGTKAEYDQNGQLSKIENQNGVAEKFLPEAITEYIKEILPNAIVTEYEKDHIQKVELNNDMELVFSKKGKFIRIED